MMTPYGQLNQEVLDLQAKMKIKPDFSNVLQRVRNASLTMKVKYKRAVLANAIDNLLDGNDF
ncbi:hypothetical protein D3C78_308700 [compost metagenome]